MALYTVHISGWYTKHTSLKSSLGYVTIIDLFPLQMRTIRAMSCNHKHCRSTRESGSRTKDIGEGQPVFLGGRTHSYVFFKLHRFSLRYNEREFLVLWFLCGLHFPKYFSWQCNCICMYLSCISDCTYRISVSRFSRSLFFSATHWREYKIKQAGE